MNRISLISESMAGTSMVSASMSRREEEGESLVFYEKLIGDGTAYIDTAFVAPVDTIIEAWITPTALSSRFYSQQAKQPGWYYQDLYMFSHNSTTTVMRGGNGSYDNYSIPAPTPFGEKFFFRCDSTGYYIGTSFLSATRQNVSRPSPYTFRFAQGGGHKTHRFILKDASENILYDFRPCKYNGVCGMWDIVNGVFYGNANTSGEFSVDGEIEMLEFYDKLVGDGTSYVLLNVPNVRSDNGKIYEYKFTACPKNDSGFVYGTRFSKNGSYLDTIGFTKQSGQNYCGPVALRSSYTNHYNYVLGHKYESIITSGATGSLVCTDLNTSVKRTYNGASYPSGAIAVFSEFGFDIGTNAWSEIEGHRDSGYFWGLTITNKTGNKVEADFKPCKFLGECGLYDTINKVFYGNSNTSGSLSVAND